ncbi:MAG TPA: MarR family winged helix-turn-helix transcriptional regulator, partial [Myxococcaceae bacterium]|nr:MarR family winged helix-turn-helix transcriptional regulator [Myxococcaceae bacterium]
QGTLLDEPRKPRGSRPAARKPPEDETEELSFFKEAPLLRVAEELSLDRTTLTRNLEPLERAGLVASAPGKDQRVRLLRLTDAGQRALQRAYPLWEEAQAKVMKALGQRRWMTLLEGLDATSRLQEKE